MAAERMDPDADDPDVVGIAHRSASAAGANAYVTTASGTAPGAGDQRQLHRHPDLKLPRIGHGQARLDAHLTRQLDVPDAVRFERVRVIDRVRR